MAHTEVSPQPGRLFNVNCCDRTAKDHARQADKKNKHRFRLIGSLPLTESALDFRGLGPLPGCSCLRGAMSLNALRFYARAGFVRRGGQPRLRSAGLHVPVTWMEKSLRA